MDNNVDNLKRLIDNLKGLGFWGRLFAWKKVRTQLIDAAADLQKLISNIDNLQADISERVTTLNGLSKDLQLKNDYLIKRETEIEKLNVILNDLNIKASGYSAEISSITQNLRGKEEQIKQLSTDNVLLAEKYSHQLSENRNLAESSGSSSQTISDLSKRNTELGIELAETKRDFQNIQSELNELKKQNTELLKEEEFRQQKNANSIASLEKLQTLIQAERSKEIEERNTREIERIRGLKETWANHQEKVKNSIKSICQKQTVQYIDKVPFKGDPDNTLLICDEFVVFDAKSPGNDDLTNFSNYLKDQAEKAKKYSKQESVKPDIFFVVPSNTLEILTTFVYRHGDHNVYLISTEALEPVILGLRKIEEYEFAEQLNPEDRENICRVLGRFAHLSKRRIQVDSFFASQFIELAYKCENALPKDILDSVFEFEKAEKLNPPQEKRAKAIPIGELEKENKRINQEAESRGIIIGGENISNSLNELPLYKRQDNGE